ncbi:APC family permease [Acidomonas methanolica]|uniref:Amino acid permease n=1 Tax=Acidomonas methanolica NBRC 104435 TaxID=1231351 RepID=A0A023D1M7_ACIMT|nr:amino acid permease [Acidomonas methanolica]MBU2653365.1 amino acid permease [Acidomonas methanolica]TCS32316.1 amino acid/polyamine/organocation transporter (APC superfamily) [Acidomonas methanolica]GAJ27691.1 amino acid permease [Acidomonas methanolica NBRC 104435]GBQ56500.1 amino acid transporter [Acidomonas methanolica]GEK97753.1 amino acid transporter [Acidomonas methanolica NBRC 104435]
MSLLHGALTRRKPIQTVPPAGEEKTGEETHGLRRVLSGFDLILLGVGTTIGAGLFSLTGVAAAQNAGPAVILAFAIAAVACGFAGLCYAELAAMIPVAGSAYSYVYATLGELTAWIIGWDLVLEYTVGAATVAVSWSGYLTSVFAGWGLPLDPRWTASPFTTITLPDGTHAHAILNVPAILAVWLITALLVRGISESAKVNAVVVALKLGVVAAVIIFCTPYIDTANYHPFLPPNTGQFGQFGFSGVMRAAGMVFFAYLGFDIVSTTAQETKNPARALPVGILGSLVICTLIYIAFSAVLTGVVSYKTMIDDSSPVATAIDHTHRIWLQNAVKISVLLGYVSVLLGLMLGQVRVFYTMARDGLLPALFGRLNPRSRTPVVSHLIFAVLTCALAGTTPIAVLGSMTSIGTLLAFVLVCVGVAVLQRRDPDRPRPFRVPGGPIIPVLGTLSCLAVMASLDRLTWIRLIVWLALGMIIYRVYGYRRSHLATGKTQP